MDSSRQLLSHLDYVIFFGSLILVMIIGLWAGRKEDTAQDFYLAGKDARWWGVAGSIFGSNVSANHIVGMMGVGFSLGFVESHFEITAIAGLLLLCYFFLPVYRKLNIYTLSDYLSRRYDDRSRVAYAIIMITIIVVVMMVPAFYIGSRALNILLADQSVVQQALDAAAAGNPTGIQINQTTYIVGILIMAVVAGSYTIFGGLKAVIITDVIQSVFMLVGAAIVAYLTLGQSEIGGWAGMRAMDAEGKDLMHLYLPMNHPARPWSGMLSGLLILHFYYWSANQFIVQRALAARSDREARIGIVTAGFFKLLIPFMSIGTGVAAYYFFQAKMPGVPVDGDTAFPLLMREVVAPVGWGLAGLVAAGLIGAILSSVDSMLNSAATLITFDIYKRFVNPDATEKQLIRTGRICITFFVVGSALLTIFIFDPNSREPFFTYVARHQSRLIAGLVVAFGMGMLWKGATAAGGFASIITGVVVSYGLLPVYAATLGKSETFQPWLGEQLNFFHAVFVAAICATIVHFLVSKLTQPDESKGQLTWHGLGLISKKQLRIIGIRILLSIIVFAVLGALMARSTIQPSIAAFLGAGWTLGLIFYAVRQSPRKSEETGLDDRHLAGVLAACAVYVLFYFY
jgi:SSS family solute:Na+ symporter